MKKNTIIRGIELLALIGLALVPSLGYAQQRGQGLTMQHQQNVPVENAASRHRQWLAKLQSKEAAQSNEERLVRRAYALLMRYHQAANAETAAKDQVQHLVTADVRFELNDMQTGSIEEILDEPITKFITLHRGSTLLVWPELYSYNGGPKHILYRVRWSGQRQLTEPTQEDSMESEAEGVETTVREFLADDPNLANVARYTFYQVKVELSGRARSYKAMALFYNHPQKAAEITIRFVDWVVGPTPLSKVLQENLPPVRSPWNSYIHSATYRAVVRAIMQTKEQGLPLIPKEAPLGYLPGDDAIADEEDERMAIATAAACQNLDFTITFNRVNISPTGTSGTSSATVTVQTVPPTPNLGVQVFLGGIDNVGGHINHTGARPPGALAATQGVTGADGAFRTTYIAPIFGGEVPVFARVTGVAVDKGEVMQVTVPGLGSLGGGQNYILVGTTVTHPDNHYGTMTALTNLPLIANDYKSQFYGKNAIPELEKLKYNDMSLVNGGKFEIAGNWGDGPHAEHRTGINCDVYSANVPPARWERLNQIFLSRGVRSINDETACCNHWHLRF
ncbi:MAG: hypothetical protein AB1757_30740 [Acidobacteriota bacterium]